MRTDEETHHDDEEKDRLRGLIAAAVLVTGAAGAQEHGPRDPAVFEKRFKDADKNGDGKLAKDEAETLPMIAKNFDAIDAKKAGSVTLEDVKAWMSARRAANGGGAPPPGREVTFPVGRHADRHLRAAT